MAVVLAFTLSLHSMGGRRRRRVSLLEKRVIGSVDSAFRVVGLSAHVFLTGIGLRPDVLLLRLCDRLYSRLGSWGLLSDVRDDDSRSPAAAAVIATALLPVSCVSRASSSVCLVSQDDCLLLGSSESADQSLTSLLLADMGDSTQAGVEFNGIRDSYAADSDIVCRFIYTDCEWESGDVVAIKKIAWKESELQTWLASVDASEAAVETKESRIMRIAFSPSLLSGLKTSDDLFQFCYISGSTLRGASTPFAIIRPKEGDYSDFSREEELNEDDGFVVLKSPQALFQDEIEKLQTNLNHSEAVCKVWMEKVIRLEKENDKLHVEKEQLLRQQESEKEESTRAKQQLESSLEEVITRHSKSQAELTAALHLETESRQEAARALQETSDELTSVRARAAESQEALKQRVLQLQKELENKGEVVATLEQTIKSADKERQGAVADRDAAESRLLLLQSSMQRLMEESREKEEKLRETIDDLKLRLEKAAEVYEGE